MPLINDGKIKNLCITTKNSTQINSIEEYEMKEATMLYDKTNHLIRVGSTTFDGMLKKIMEQKMFAQNVEFTPTNGTDAIPGPGDVTNCIYDVGVWTLS